MKVSVTPFIFATLFACNGEPKPKQGEEPVNTDDTGTEDTGGNIDCSATMTSVPSNELPTSSWFYRDAVELTFTEVNPAVTLSAVDSQGNAVDVGFEWNESRELARVLPSSGTWAGDEDYTLTIDYCGNSDTLNFGTSEFGLPLDIAPANLVGRTYNIDLATADYTHPPGIGTLLGQNIDQPLLFGIETASASTLDFIAALGITDNFGATTQSTGLWYFPDADFADSPYFEAYAEFLQIEYGSIGIPIYDFRISGTFSADGNQIGMAHFSGLGDTRELGPALSSSFGEDAICNMLVAAGAECEVCPGESSGEAFCAYLAGSIDTVNIIPNLTLVEME